MKRTLFIIAFLAIYLSFSNNCFAKDLKGAYIIKGLGIKSCGQMTEDIKTISYAQSVYQAYINGYISGYNAAREGKEDFVEGADNISCYKFVLKYCENNPLKEVNNGLNELILQYNETF